MGAGIGTAAGAAVARLPLRSSVVTSITTSSRSNCAKCAIAPLITMRAISNSGSTAEWTFDQAGFVLPGRVALYQPSLGLKDYELQFLGAIDKGSLSWVVRAADFQNYYVVKLAVIKPGVIPQLGIIRYSVINGKPVDRVDTPVALNTRTDSLYRVRMEMQGDHFSLSVQGQVIDAWTEARLRHGGVGFFTNRGEQSRIGWVQVTHQYDTLGRLFAYLAP